MKTLPTLIGFLALTLSSHAQWTVYDPAVHSQQIVSSAKEIAKFVEMIGNQMKQLRAIEEDVATLRHYVDLFGSPAAVKPRSVDALINELEKGEVGRVMGVLLEAADPEKAMTDGGHGVFSPIGTSFHTPDGIEVPRAPALYRSAGAILETTENFLAVAGDAAARRASLKSQIAQTTASLSDARTDAEVQKLGAVLVGLGSALQSTEQEVAQATASVLVQDVSVRADERRQNGAIKEQQAAEFTEALENYGRTFRLMSAPVAFPTP